MGLRIIHTADWHLGHSLHGLSRDYEHGRFLAWLMDILEERQADALLIAGDLFDSANPPAASQAMFYGFVAEAQRRLPRLRIVAIAGNHDSAARLEAPSPILDALKVRLVGMPRRGPDGRLDVQHLLTPLYGKEGTLAAWCAAVPFLRPSDLRGDADQGEDVLVSGVAALYAEVIAAIEAVRDEGQALIAMGHCYMTGTRLSALSERKILGGNQHALPANLFPDRVTYAALGHLHLAQAAGGHAHIRYSGSPIPLSLDERGYPHQVVQLDLEGAEIGALEGLRVPRFVEMLRFPEQGSEEVDRVLAALESYPFDQALPPQCHPYLEVVVRLERPDPGLRQRIEAVLEDRPARLLKLTGDYPGRSAGLRSATPAQRLEELRPEGVFRERYRQQFDGDPPAPLLAAFHELLEQVEGV
jgi:exonuclease SbcD